MSETTNKFASEVRARAIRMVLDHEVDYPSRWATAVSIAEKIGCSPPTLHEWVKKAEVDSGKRAGVTSDVATWAGFVYVAFVIDVFARYIVGWRISRTAHASFVLDALEQAIHERKPIQGDGLIHHSDRDSQYLSITYTKRLAEAGIEPSAGSVGDSYDNALAETINGLYKAEVIHRRGPWRSRSC
jgi:transposase InsO family protein